MGYVELQMTGLLPIFTIRQHVSIGMSTKADDIVITHGVLHGSVLGPLLFLL